MEIPTEYWTHAGQQINEAEFNTLVAAGGRFTCKGSRKKMPDESWFHYQKYVFMTPATQVAHEANEAVIVAGQTWRTDVVETRKFLLKTYEKKVSGRYKKYIDKHHAKKTRIDRRGGNPHDIPQAAADYENALEAVWTAIQAEVNALTTPDDVLAYRLGENGNSVWPDTSAVGEL